MKNNSFYVEIKDNSMIINYQVTDNVLQDVCSIIELARDYAYQSVNVALVERNWFIGYRIAEEELKGENRANLEHKDITKKHRYTILL